MGNISNFNMNKIDMRLTNVDYWDFYLAKADISIVPKTTILSGDCLVAHYDFNNDTIYDDNLTGTSIYSISTSTWVGAINTGYTATTVGLTGLDNGLTPYTKLSGDSGNTVLLSALTGSTLVIQSGDTRLVMNPVTGYTGNYIYPLEIIPNSGTTVGTYSKLCGGFYQGYYKLDGNDYQVLPNRVPKSWTAELWLRKPSVDTCTGYTGTTLNEDYSGNTGFFLYFGTRAENKFWNQFAGLNTGSTSGCTSGATEWCTVPKEGDVSFIDSSGNTINLSPPPIIYTEVNNKFLMYSRAKASTGRCGTCGGAETDGKTVCNFTGDTITTSKVKEIVTDTRNPFLIYSRAKASTGRCGTCGGADVDGETVCSFSGMTSPQLELDKDADLIDNALGFRIREDGSIGYRKLVMTATCINDVTVTGCSVEEAYSISGIVTPDQWHLVSIRFVANETYDECELTWKDARKGKLMFYVDGKLKFIVKEFDEFIARRLVEHPEKQVAVPYNISIGGGTQDLIESMTFDGQDPDDLDSCLQNNFAGSFIGDISQFRFYICNLSYCDILNNFEQEKVRYLT